MSKSNLLAVLKKVIWAALALVCFLLSLTFLVWVFPFKRWLFEILTYTSLFPPKNAGGTDRWVALRVWDCLHPLTLWFSAVSFAIGMPVLLYWLFGFPAIGGEDFKKSPVAYAQFISATIFGTVALEAFLLLQLQSLLKPKVTVCCLPASGSKYVDQFTRVVVIPNTGGWIHLRVTNVGVRRYSPLSVGCVLPEGWRSGRLLQYDWDLWEASDSERRQLPLPEKVRTYSFRSQYRTVELQANSEPRETGPGDGGVYSFHAEPVLGGPENRISVLVSSEGSAGVAKYSFKVQAEDTQMAQNAESTVGGAAAPSGSGRQSFWSRHGPKVLGYASRLEHGLSPWIARLLPLDVALIGIAAVVATSTKDGTHAVQGQIQASIYWLLGASGVAAFYVLMELVRHVFEFGRGEPKKTTEYWVASYLLFWFASMVAFVMFATGLAIWFLNSAVSRWIGLGA